jgi:hypothetical protein
MTEAEKAYAVNELERVASSVNSKIRQNPELLAALSTLLGDQAKSALSKRDKQEAVIVRTGASSVPSLFE